MSIKVNLKKLTSTIVKFKPRKLSSPLKFKLQLTQQDFNMPRELLRLLLMEKSYLMIA